MVLSPLERYVLERLLANAGVSCLDVGQDDQERFKVLERERTSAGYYVIVRSNGGLEQIIPSQELCLSFTHHAFRRGGYFVCWVEDDTTLCLEAVANQQDWPGDISLVDFRCRN